VGRCELDAPGSGYRPVVSPYEHGNEYLGSIKGVKFLDYLSDY
jgi:hypothetical protein